MREDFFAGVRASVPACLGVVPVGISIGLLAVQAGLSGGEALLMSALVMAGSAQLMALGMLAQGAAWSAIIVGTFFINLRHLVMSASVMSGLQTKTTLPQRLLAAFALCDESFAIYALSGRGSYPFLLGSNTALYLSFVGGTAAGCLMTGCLPQVVVDSFGIAFYAAFLGLLLPGIKGNGGLIRLVFLTAVWNWLLQRVMPASWAVIVSMVLGALLGVNTVDMGEREREEEEMG